MPQLKSGPPSDARDPEQAADATGNANARARAMEDLLLRHYPKVQYQLVQFIADHLVDCRKSINGDFDELMILAILGQRFLDARRAKESGRVNPESLTGMSAMRLADVTGIPRESVRRKLVQLKKRGWVANDGRTGWALKGDFGSVQVRVELSELDLRGVRRLGKLLLALLPLLDELRADLAGPD